MTDPTDRGHYRQLRAWAKGIYALEAAAELLIRAGFAQEQSPWLQPLSGGSGYWIDFEHIPDHLGSVSGGERRILAIAASLGAGVPVELPEVVSGLDRRNLDLVLAAISHASGSHEHSEYVPTVLDDGHSVITPDSPRIDHGPLHPWPDESPE